MGLFITFCTVSLVLGLVFSVLLGLSFKSINKRGTHYGHNGPPSFIEKLLFYAFWTLVFAAAQLVLICGLYGFTWPTGLVLLLSLIASVNWSFRTAKQDLGQFIGGWILRFVFTLVPMWLYFYFELPPLVGPFWGLLGVLLLPLAINVAASWIEGGIRNDSYETWENVTIGCPKAGLSLLIVVAGLHFGISFFNSTVFRADEYQSMIGEIDDVPWQGHLPSASTERIRLVMPPMAQERASKTVGDIGSSFHVGQLSIQRQGGELKYVSDYEYNDWIQGISIDASPGIVTLSSQNPVGVAVPDKTRTLRYTPSAAFSRNLYRKLYLEGYATYRLVDASIELDEEGKEWFIVTAMRPTIAWSADAIEGVVQVDPETGEHEFHPIDKLPDWIDLVTPDEVFIERLNWHGGLKNGWVPWVFGWGSKVGLFTPTNGNPLLVWPDGSDQAMLFKGTTSWSNTDSALTSMYLCGTRDGQVRRLVLPEGSNPFSEESVLSRMNQMVAEKNGEWYCPGALPYEFEGSICWIGPIVDRDENAFQTMAVVNFEQDFKALDKDLRQALALYRAELQRSSDVQLAKSADALEGTFEVVQVLAEPRGGDQYYLIKTKELGTGRWFVALWSLHSQLRWLEPGMKIQVSYAETKEAEEVRIVEVKEISPN